MNASIIDGLLTSAAGIYVCLIAFGVVSPTKDKAKGEEWRRKWGGFLKIGGPFVVVWGLYIIVSHI